jgi:hypothetical protein
VWKVYFEETLTPAHSQISHVQNRELEQVLASGPCAMSVCPHQQVLVLLGADKSSMCALHFQGLAERGGHRSLHATQLHAHLTAAFEVYKVKLPEKNLLSEEEHFGAIVTETAVQVASIVDTIVGGAVDTAARRKNIMSLLGAEPYGALHPTCWPDACQSCVVDKDISKALQGI